MLTDFQNFFIVEFINKFATNWRHIAHHTINVLLHYLVKWQLSQTAIFISKQCIQHH